MDRISKANRSKVMASIRSTENKSTERKLRSALARAGLRGWALRPPDIPGCPDFVFRGSRLAVFVDGCFWHGCPRCYRRPHSSSEYWDAKVIRNRRRDSSVRSRLRREGWSVISIWEHDLTTPGRAVQRIRAKLAQGARRTTLKLPATDHTRHEAHQPPPIRKIRR